MDVKKRILRRPLRTALWQAVLIAMALLMGVGSVLVYSSQRLITLLDEHQTTIAVQLIDQEKVGPSEWVSYPVVLYQEDIEALKELDMVKDIDLRTLTGAYIPELSARLGLTNRYNSELLDVDWMNGWGANYSYEKVVLAGTVEKAWMASYGSVYNYDLSAIGGPELAEGYTYRALVNIEQVIVGHEDYIFFPDEQFSGYNGKVIVSMPGFYAEGDDNFGENFFEVGQTYVLRGEYDPGASRRGGDPDDIPFSPRLELGKISLNSFGYCMKEENQLVIYSDFESVGSSSSVPTLTDKGAETVLNYGGERTVVAEKVETTVEELILTEHWADDIALYDMMLHSFPVLGTQKLESMYVFVQNEAVIVDGRTFSKEEYDSGENVCIISESVANAAGIRAGDSVTFNQFQVPKTYGEGNSTLDPGTSGTLNNPGIGFVPIPYGLETENESFIVVGIYRLENEWEDSAFSISPNTIFVPQKAQIEGGFGGASYNYEEISTYYEKPADSDEWIEVTGPHDVAMDNGVLGVYMSVILENGSMEEFRQAIADSDYADRMFLTFDQGYETARENVQAVINMAKKLFFIAAVGWSLLLLLYILLGQSPERKNLGIMRSVGAKPYQTRRYLFASGILPAAIGVTVGTLLSNTVAKLVQDKLVSLTLLQAQSSAHSGGIKMDNSDLTGVLTQSVLSIEGVLILAIIQIAIIAVLLWIHAAYLSQKKPRKLMGV